MIIGHQKQWQFLEKSVKLGRFSHAYLFSGQEKLGKKTIAYEFIKLFFGSDIRQSHPDFIFIAPAEQEIQIKQIRELNWRLSLKPFSAPLKAAIIDQAHLMNAEAQNCFLKTLEEPRGETLLILISEYPEFLFPTIRSRTEIIKFYPVPRKEIEDYLKDQRVGEEKSRLMSQISQGRPGVAIDFLNYPQKLKGRETLISEIAKLTKSDLNFRFQYAKKISKTTNLKKILDVWLFHFREILLSKLNKNSIDKIDIDNAAKISKIKNILEKIQGTNFLISTTNVNPRLALEILMLEL
jgi:DNA polymerase-3 subunit delta'